MDLRRYAHDVSSANNPGSPQAADRDARARSKRRAFSGSLPIQTQADAGGDNAASIITSAGVAIRKTPVHKPRVFEAKPGKVSGSVELVAASAARRASYEWESSTDGGKTWVALPVTLQARTTVTGLTPGATVTFRSRPVTKTGEGDWSQPASIIVR